MENDIVGTLRKATRECSDRGLTFAAKWSAELLLAIPAERRTTKARQEMYEAAQKAQTGDSLQLATTTNTQPSTPEDELEAQLQEDEQDLLTTGRIYAEAKEFTRAAHLLLDCKSSKGKFMSIYFQFLASEKKALRDWHNLDFQLHQKDPHQPATPINRSIHELLLSLLNVTDPWLLFLKALLLKRESRREEAIEALILSIGKYPWNWSAWVLLGTCISDRDEYAALLPLLPLPQTHPLVKMFQLKTLVDLHQPDENDLATVDGLLSPDFFPNSKWLMSMRACVLYYTHEWARAEAQFDRILVIDPYRVDDIDVYSNILYVTDNRTKLSKLAHHFLQVDKDRPEICGLVGNHYSMRAESEKAIQYFRRATELNQAFMPAWTLMGHEYIELKNPHAAVESYRRAIDIERKDYRAWYGLGQAYELLNMHHYALYYLQKAASLKPYDPRLWQAQGTCYEELGRTQEAIECYKRSLVGADPKESHVKEKLARLLAEVGDHAAAIEYHKLLVESEVADADGAGPVRLYIKSFMAVARYNMQEGRDLEKTDDYLKRVADTSTEDAIIARELRKKLAAMMSKSTVPPHS